MTPEAPTSTDVRTGTASRTTSVGATPTTSAGSATGDADTAQVPCVDIRASDLRGAAPEQLANRASRRRPLGVGRRAASAADRLTPAHIGPEVFAAVEAYWHAARSTAWVPRRSDIDPDAIADALPATMILERVSPGIARIRVAGQLVGQACGMDPRGMPLSVFFAPAARRMLGAHIELAFAGPAIVQIPLTTPRRLLRAGIPGSLLILPLDDGSGQITRALAVLVTDAPLPRQAAVRFDIPDTRAPRIDVIPAPTVLRPVSSRSVRTEPPVARTMERRATGGTPPVAAERAYKRFEVVHGSGKTSIASATGAAQRPALSLVVSNG